MSFLRMLGNIPQKCYLACSGGIDSMVMLNFLLRSEKEVHLLYFKNNSKDSDVNASFIRQESSRLGVNLSVGETESWLSPKTVPYSDTEEFWRDQRYRWFDEFSDYPIITAHHLDDVVDWWIFTSFQGQSKLLSYAYGNIIRPMIITKKDNIEKWAKEKSVNFINDEHRWDIKSIRNRIRRRIIPEAKHINPMIYKVMAKKIIERWDENTQK